MTKLPWWKRSLMVLGAVVAVVAALAGQPRKGISAEPDPQAPAKQEFRYFGSKECATCHSASKERPTIFSDAIGFIYLDEYTRWMDQDKHKMAFARLTSERGRRMASLLKMDVTDRKTGCLGCHSAGTAEASAAARRQGDFFDPNEGVSCENCHGPYSGWDQPHRSVNFRSVKAEERKSLGMIDVRVPEIQAAQCLSCHIGNSAEGKVVTHEMYAAGHPPLPSIEVATFTNFIPRHWMLVREKTSPKVKEAAGFKDGDLEQTKLAMVGAAVALKTSMQLLSDEAKIAEKTGVPGQEWPDYARFDCWSCHHDLKRESWRQARGYKGPPGRVPVSEWPLALVDLGIDRLAQDDPANVVLRSDLERLQKALHSQASNRPFGQQVPLSKAAGDLAEWSNVLITKLSAAKFDQSEATKLLRKLVEKAELLTPDYDSARHVAWTIKLLVGELGDKLPNRKPIEDIIKKFDEGLKLELPAGQKYEIEDQLAEALNIIGDYDPATFKAQLKELLELLPK